MADKKVTIKVDLDAEPSIAGLKELKKELREISVTDPKFAEKQQQIEDYTDALKSAKTGAGNFADILGELPGPLGDVGNKVAGTITTLKQFGGIKLDSLKASFSELGKDIVDAGKGIGNLTGITKAYTTISDLLAASFTKVGIAEGYAATGAKLLSGALIATGIGALVVVLGNLVSMLMDYFDSSKRAEKAANDFSDAIKRQNELLEANLGQIDFENKKKLLQAKIAGESEANLNKITADGLQERYNQIKAANDAILAEQRALALRQGKYAKMSDEERAAVAEKNLEQINKLGAEESKAREAIELNKLQVQADAAEKGRQNDEKAGAQRLSTIERNNEQAKKVREQELAQIAKEREEARITLLGDEEKEVATITASYKTKIDLAKKHGQDTKTLEEALAKEIKRIRGKYRKEDNDAMKQGLIDDLQAIIDGNKKNFEEQKLQLDLQKAKGLISEDEYQQKLYDAKLKYANSGADIINAEIDKLNFLSEKKKENADKDKEWADKQLEYNKVIAESWIDLGRTTADTFVKLGGLFEEGSDAAKAFGIASVLIGAATSIAQINFKFAEGIADARSTITKGQAIAAQGVGLLGNPVTAPIGAAMIASGGSAAGAGSALLAKLQINKGLQIAGVVATSAAQIAAITSAKGKSGGAASGAGSGEMGGTGGAAPTFAGAASMAAPQIQTTGGMNPTTQIAETITGARAPLKAYVVSGEISSQQALDRRTNRAATFSEA